MIIITIIIRQNKQVSETFIIFIILNYIYIVYVIKLKNDYNVGI